MLTLYIKEAVFGQRSILADSTLKLSKGEHIHIAYDKVLIEDGFMNIHPAAITLIHGLSESGKKYAAISYRLNCEGS